MPAQIVNVHAAKTNLSRLLERVEAGEEVIIGRAGKPIARIVPYVSVSRDPWFGAMKGQIRVLPGFDEIDAELEQEFEDSVERPIEP
jgi:prevent-host-death family protein